MFKRILIGCLLLVTSCDNASKPGRDGYTFVNPQYTQNQVIVKFVIYKNYNDISRAALNRGVSLAPSIKLVAFTELKPPFTACTIHMIDPMIDYSPEFIGHELIHCRNGQWHTNNDSKQ